MNTTLRILKIKLSHEIFFKFSLRPFEVIEVEKRSMLNFEAATLKFCNCFRKFDSLPQKHFQNSDLFDFAIFYCTLVINANRSEFWNRLSYLFEVRSRTFRNNCKISRSQPQNSTFHFLNCNFLLAQIRMFIK